MINRQSGVSPSILLYVYLARSGMTLKVQLLRVRSTRRRRRGCLTMQGFQGLGYQTHLARSGMTLNVQLLRVRRYAEAPARLCWVTARVFRDQGKTHTWRGRA